MTQKQRYKQAPYLTKGTNWPEADYSFVFSDHPPHLATKRKRDYYLIRKAKRLAEEQ